MMRVNKEYPTDELPKQSQREKEFFDSTDHLLVLKSDLPRTQISSVSKKPGRAAPAGWRHSCCFGASAALRLCHGADRTSTKLSWSFPVSQRSHLVAHQSLSRPLALVKTRNSKSPSCGHNMEKKTRLAPLVVHLQNESTRFDFSTSAGCEIRLDKTPLSRARSVPGDLRRQHQCFPRQSHSDRFGMPWFSSVMLRVQNNPPKKLTRGSRRKERDFLRIFPR
ncbi:uncharacterized protein BJX67DRAFT_287108 [Aspergillus lucknowensis]|uniref:Uncharacterized protein n=1 Tax=Aspergillus lucknowensis TaxID=176173 RepID=A0ABR4M2X1_9EURO